MPRYTRELLVERGVASPEAVMQAEAAATRNGTGVCSELLAAGEAEERALVAILAERHGLPGVDLSRSEIPGSALDLVPPGVARADSILPLSTEGGRLHLAVSGPDETGRVLTEVRFVTGMEVSLYIAVGSSLRAAIAAAYTGRERGGEAWRGARARPGGGLALCAPRRSRPAGGSGPRPAPVDAGLAAGVDPGADARRVLVVDDEPEIRNLLAHALGARGFLVETAHDGEEALACVAARHPALVLLDAMLPRIHGFEVARRLRADARTRDIPIVMMTAVYRGWRFAQDTREAYGAEDYVEKPFRLDDLIGRVEAVLEITATRAPVAPSGGEALLRRGRDLLRAGRIEAAVAALGEAVAADPFSADAHHQLARAFREQGEDFQAMTSFERAVELRPDHFVALRGLAALYAEKGFRRKAVETLERALPVAPDPASRESVRAELLDLLEG